MREGDAKAARKIQLLLAGTRAAHRSLFRQDERKDEEYSSDPLAVYSGLEDALYALYSAIRQGQKKKMLRAAGDIIAQASVIAEMAEGPPEKRWGAGGTKQ